MAFQQDQRDMLNNSKESLEHNKNIIKTLEIIENELHELNQKLTNKGIV